MSLYFMNNANGGPIQGGIRGVEILPQDNAAVVGDVNATTGWSTAVSAVVTSDSTASTGSWALKTVFNGANSRSFYDLNALGLVDGANYILTCDVRHIGTSGSAGNCRFHFSDNNVAQTTLIVELGKTATTYNSYEKQFVYGSTRRYLVCKEVNSTNDGGLYVDNLSIKTA